MKIARSKRFKAAAPAVGSLSGAERSELARQGAKAAARGDAISSNPMSRQVNQPAVTSEANDVWAARRDAWSAGHRNQTAEAGDGAAPSALDDRR